MSLLRTFDETNGDKGGSTRLPTGLPSQQITQAATLVGEGAFVDLGFKPDEAAALTAESQRIITETLS